MKRGNTAMVLESFIEGMTSAGTDVELSYASRLKVKPCACDNMYCWFTEPGKCCIDDDMETLYPRLKEAQTLVIATPVYIPLPTDMQTVINRLCPLIFPALKTRDGRTRAELRNDVSLERIALVATGGWWELENFDTVVRIAREFSETAGLEYAGAVLRPHAALMRPNGEVTEEGQRVLQAVNKAGVELATEGTMHADTIEEISRPLIPRDDLRRWLNQLVGA
jgi:multimeric flavodoxin WrbA